MTSVTAGSKGSCPRCPGTFSLNGDIFVCSKCGFQKYKKYNPF